MMTSRLARTMPHIAVIGAGFSGLRCADVLLRGGANVTIFEARDRVGGRVQQCINDGHLVDTGPNWIHGTEGNPIMELAEKTGSFIVEPDGRQMVVDSEGLPMSEKESVELGAETWATVVNAFKHSNEKHSSIDPTMSLMQYFRQELPNRFPKDEKKVEVLLKEASMWGAFVGEDIERQSLRCFFLEECLEGENVILTSTYESILSEVAMNAVQNAEVRYKEEVVEIVYRNEPEERKPVTVVTRNGARAEFDEVVVTCPLGWLKRNKAAFSPALPLRMVQAIDNIGYGRLEKFYVSFPSAFWITAEDSQASGSISPASTTSAASSGSLTSVSPQEPIFTHFHHPSYHPDPASRSGETGNWNLSLVSMAHFPAKTAHPTLLFYLYGLQGTYLTSLLASHAPHSSAYNSIMYSFAHPYFSRLPNYSHTDPACIPQSYLCTSWQQDEFAGFGSYSNFQVGLVDGDKDIEVMRECCGMSDAGRGIWLAGEHVAPFVAVGTTTGAYWSGESVARKILSRYGVDCHLEDDKIAGETRRKDPNKKEMDGANLSGLAI